MVSKKMYESVKLESDDNLLDNSISNSDDDEYIGIMEKLIIKYTNMGLNKVVVWLPRSDQSTTTMEYDEVVYDAYEKFRNEYYRKEFTKKFNGNKIKLKFKYAFTSKRYDPNLKMYRVTYGGLILVFKWKNSGSNNCNIM